MKFRTEYTPKPSEFKLDPKRPIVLVGSCFASNIANKMQQSMWDAFNGVGTLYNPVSISIVLDSLLFNHDSSYIRASLFESEGKIHSWLFDSHFSAPSSEECLKKIETSKVELRSALSKAQALIVTFGTSWCYELISSPDNEGSQKDYIVANCHKMPSSLFNRKRVSIEEIASIWIDLCSRLIEEYPDLKILFTVSPVRHLKDGFEGNTLSKATLHLAIERICEQIPAAYYFPAYEIVCDDLRDYRFYAGDLVHPSEAAVEYIWEVFCKTYLDEKGMATIKEGIKLYKQLNHRPIMK